MVRCSDRSRSVARTGHILLLAVDGLLMILLIPVVTSHFWRCIDTTAGRSELPGFRRLERHLAEHTRWGGGGVAMEVVHVYGGQKVYENATLNWLTLLLFFYSWCVCVVAVWPVGRSPPGEYT